MKIPLVYNLIHALDRNEKGYFVKQLSKKESAYGELFKLLIKQKSYNENEIKNKFKSSYISKNLSFSLNYLYHKILKSLIQYNSNKKEAYYLFHSIMILYRKGLYQNCAKMIKQVVKLANKTDDYISILRAIEYVKYLNQSTIQFDADLENILLAENDILKQQQIVSTYQLLLTKIKKARYLTGNMKQKDSVNIAMYIINHELMSTNIQLINNLCKQLYHETLFLCGFVLQDFNLSKKHFKPLQKLVDEPINQKFLNDYQRTDILKQLIRFNIIAKDFPSAHRNLLKTRKLIHESKQINQSEKIATLFDCYNFEMDLMINENNFINSEQIMNEVDEFILENSDYLPEKFFIVYYSNSIILNFSLKNHKKVLDLSNKVLTSSIIKLRHDIIISVMLTEVVVFYELEKMEVFENKLQAFDRYIKRYRIKEPMWKFFSKLLNGLLKENDKNTSIHSFFEDIKPYKNNRIVVDLIFLVNWAKSKLKT